MVRKNTWLGFSEQGRRTYNEDSFVCGEIRNVLTGDDYTYACVCDGVGSAELGKDSSQELVDMIQRVLRDLIQKCGDVNFDILLERLTKELDIINSNWFKQNTANRKLVYGSTIVLLITKGYEGLWLNIGDSRLYELDYIEETLNVVSVDDSLVQQKLRDGEMSKVTKETKGQGKLLNCVGAQGNLRYNFGLIEDLSDKGYLLCSDGLWGTVMNRDIIDTITQKMSVPFVIEQALALGSTDNITVAVKKTF